jgi:hypothetical protein
MRLPLFGFVLLAAACSLAPAVQVTTLAPSPAAPKPLDYPIALYHEQLPRCAFDEIALVSVRQRSPRTSADALAEEMRVNARKVGGDAVVHVASEAMVRGATRSGNDAVELDHAMTLAGTVVRFRDRACKEPSVSGG